VVLFIESLNVNICRFKKDFILRGGGAGERAIVLKYHSDLEGCKGIQRICFDTRLQCFKYAFLIAAYRPLQKDASKKKLDELTVNGREGAKFPIVDFNCLNGQFPVTLKGIDIFERANAHLKIGVTVLQYETEFGEGHRSDKKGVLFPVRAPSIESVEHWVWLLYTPTAEPDSIGHFNTITDISRVLGEGKKRGGLCYYCPTCLSRYRSDLKLKHYMKHCKRHGYQAVETVSGDRTILRFKNFQNTLLLSNKIALDCKVKQTDVYDSSNSNRVKIHEAIGVSYAHAQRDSNNTMQVLDVVDGIGQSNQNSERCNFAPSLYKLSYAPITR
jgi:hypothetical protein